MASYQESLGKEKQIMCLSLNEGPADYSLTLTMPFIIDQTLFNFSTFSHLFQFPLGDFSLLCYADSTFNVAVLSTGHVEQSVGFKK